VNSGARGWSRPDPVRAAWLRVGGPLLPRPAERAPLAVKCELRRGLLRVSIRRGPVPRPRRPQQIESPDTPGWFTQSALGVGDAPMAGAAAAPASDRRPAEARRRTAQRRTIGLLYSFVFLYEATEGRAAKAGYLTARCTRSGTSVTPSAPSGEPPPTSTAPGTTSGTTGGPGTEARALISALTCCRREGGLGRPCRRWTLTPHECAA
jgi:hypothetical protein